MNNLSQFWQELKRRNVIHVIIVYATAAFVIIELVNNVTDPLKLPEWTPTMVIVILLVGFPLAIIFSWIFDVTPDGIERTKPSKELPKGDKPLVPNSWRIATYVSVVIIIGLLAFNIFKSSDRVKIDESLEKSIAILPFHNFSGDPNKEYICDGLTAEIINHLYRIESFDKVVSLTSVLIYKDSDKNTSEIAEELKVNYILEGSYKRIGEQLRITAQLIEPKSDKYIWQHDFDKPYKDIIAIPANIALQIADHLKAFLTVPEKQNIQKIPTSNEEAYDKYQLGNYYFRKGRFKKNINSAINFYKEAITLDPNFALAYTSLAKSYLVNYWYRFDQIEISLIESKIAIDAAFKIDPKLPEAFIQLANYYYHGFLDYPNALEQLKIASEYLPDQPEVKYYKALVYRRMGEWENSIEEFESAFENDPVSIWIIQNMVNTYTSIGKYQEALNYSKKAIMINPDNIVNYDMKIHNYILRDGNTIKAREVLAEVASMNMSKDLMNEALYISPIWINIYDGNYQQALDFLASTDWEGHLNLIRYYPKSLFQALIYDLIGTVEKANELYDSTRIQLEELLIEDPDDPRYLNSLGIAYAGLGEKEKAISYGEKAVKLYPMNKDKYFGLIRIEELAWMYVMVEEYDAALEQIKILLSNPGPYSAPLLKLDPKWKPLWDHPEFVWLTEKYAEK